MLNPAFFVPKPPIEKLCLVVQKDIRDKFESQREDFESQISDLLRVDFHININANEVWAYKLPNSTLSAGIVLKRYVEGFVEALKNYINTFDDDGRAHFNDAVVRKELNLSVNDVGNEAKIISADIKDGVFRILFHHESLGYNHKYLYEHLLKAVEDVPREDFSIVAKKSIKENYCLKIEKLTKEIADMIAMPGVILNPNFKENYAAISAVKSDKDWQQRFGEITYRYFDGLKWRWALGIRLVKETKDNKDVENVLVDGTVYIQMEAGKWGYDTEGGGRDLLELL